MDVGKDIDVEYTKFSEQTASTTQKKMKWKGGQNQMAYINAIETESRPLKWPYQVKDKGICKALCVEWLQFIIVDEYTIDKMYCFIDFDHRYDFLRGKKIKETPWDALQRVVSNQGKYSMDCMALNNPKKKDTSFWLSYDKEVSARTIKDVDKALIEMCSEGKMEIIFSEEMGKDDFINFFNNFSSQVFWPRSPRYFMLDLRWGEGDKAEGHAIAGVVNRDDIVVYEPNSGVYTLLKSGGMEELLCQMNLDGITAKSYLFSEIAATDCGCGCCEIA